MKPNKWCFFKVEEGDFHVEFLDTFLFSCSLRPFVFFCISTVTSRAQLDPKRKLVFCLAMWKFTSGRIGLRGHQKMCFDLNGIEFRLPWFKELKVPAQRRAPAEPVGS